MNTDALERARAVLDTEAQAILCMKERMGDEIGRVVDMILACEGKVVVCGVGKSGAIARKMAGTLASTGTPSVHLEPVDALHGDLGIVAAGDLLIGISNSGESEELLNVVNGATALGARLVAMTGNAASSLAREADVVIDTSVAAEACPLGLAPTASTTAALAMGDAIAMVVMELRGFRREDYAQFHPGGRLGQRLKLRVRDIMRVGEDIPVIGQTEPLRRALEVMSTASNLGVVLAVDEDGKLAGILTDGDIRRILLRADDKNDLLASPVEQWMTRRPKTIDADVSAMEALAVMERGTSQITSLAIVGAHGRPEGLILLHDILGRGKFTA
jgi:arabinose-5-phosphate isomerase